MAIFIRGNPKSSDWMDMTHYTIMKWFFTHIWSLFAPFNLAHAIIFFFFFSLHQQQQPRDSSGIDLNGIKPKTSFTCRGKESGYYADIETDCQVYHLCDEQGRKFTYECPNTTLFHQRMLICDHWYMVDCSTSEANYEFNRLIGQRVSERRFLRNVGN